MLEVKCVRSLLVKEQHREENIVTSIPNEPESTEKPKSTGEAKQLSNLQPAKVTNNPDLTELLESYQNMKAEEHRLTEQKQQLLIKQHDFQSALVKEMEKMKATIANLNSEIPELENKTRKLGEALGKDT